MGKVPWGSMLGAMLASMLGSSCQGMGEATIGKIPVGFHVGVMLIPVDWMFPADLPLLARSPRAVASPVGST